MFVLKIRFNCYTEFASNLFKKNKKVIKLIFRLINIFWLITNFLTPKLVHIPKKRRVIFF